MQSGGRSFEKKRRLQLFGMHLEYIDVPEQCSVDCSHEYDFQQMDDSDTLFVKKWYVLF